MALGLVAGFSIGVVFTVIIFVAWFNTLSQALVGIGTLAVSFVALYQSRLGVEERHKRDLAQRVYTPLRAEVVKWLDPETQTFYVWNELQEKELYWVKKVPKDMTTLLNEGREAFRRLLAARIALNTLTLNETTRLGNELRKNLGLTIHEGQSPPTIRIMAGNQGLIGQVYPENVWLTRKGLRDYVMTLVNRSYRGIDWTAEILVDGHPRGGLPEAEEFMGKIMEFFEGQPQARELRESSEKLRTLGSKLLLRLDEELG